MTFAKTRLGIDVKEFWQMTFGEFWPLYNAAIGNTVKPLSRDEIDDFNERLVNGNN